MLTPDDVNDMRQSRRQPPAAPRLVHPGAAAYNGRHDARCDCTQEGEARRPAIEAGAASIIARG